MKLTGEYILSILAFFSLFAPLSRAQDFHVDTIQVIHPIDTVEIAQSIDTVKVTQLVDTIKVAQHIDTIPINQPIDTTKAIQPADTVKVAQVVDSTKAVRDRFKIDQLVDAIQKEKNKLAEKIKDFLKEQALKSNIDSILRHHFVPEAPVDIVEVLPIEQISKFKDDTSKDLSIQGVQESQIETAQKAYTDKTLSLNTNKILQQADSLRLEYNFAKALEIYSDIQEGAIDSLALIEIEAKKLLCENGLAMTAFVATPTVVARQKFSLNEFFLYYPLPDKTWRKYPNVLDTTNINIDSTLVCPPRVAVYVKDSDEEIYFSAIDENGINNIYITQKDDNLWSWPVLLNENLTTDSNEIFPMLSKDKKSLYFSSEGLYGMGGYDLFVSHWDEEEDDWGDPINLGFPFSSPANDYLLVNTEDSKYTIFASDRGCCRDSVWVYVLDYEDFPVRKAESDPAVLKELSQLNPILDPFKLDAGSAVDSEIADNKDVQKYMEKMSRVNTLRDSIDVYNRELDILRESYALSENIREREKLTNIILNKEQKLTEFQDLHADARTELYKIEMDFLYSGVVIDLGKLMERADREIVGESTNYTFAKRNFGEALIMDMLPPPVEFDYSFKILDIGRFALDNALPDSLIYQIQIFSKSTRASEKHLNGLSPVFEKESNGKFIYRVGLFTTYNDVLSNLNKVKRAGFKTAFIVAFNNGEEIAISEAKKIEQDILK